jgi:hypothetical protein
MKRVVIVIAIWMIGAVAAALAFESCKPSDDRRDVIAVATGLAWPAIAVSRIAMWSINPTRAANPIGCPAVKTVSER